MRRRRFFFWLAGVATSHAGAAPTFTREVAPIVFQNCVTCHHPAGPGPFPLTTYREVKKHAQQIAKVTAARSMPPWLPAPGHGEFEGARTLTPEQIATLADWVKGGAPEGAAEDLKVKAEWPDGWQLGKPDLVVTMPEPYLLPASGPDAYRNFVIPSVVAETRFVTAFELRSSTPQAVHHAFLLLDSSGGARRLDEKDPGPGFSGMNTGPETGPPAGIFASWQPGSRPEKRPDGMSWVLPKRSDVVLQLHLRPTGKKEKVQVSVGFYFTDKPPARVPLVMCLRSVAIDIPAGDANYTIENSYTLPVDGEVLSVLPHQHYLGKEARAWAELPDGTQRDLIWIPHWNFDWQGSYRFVTPVSLPQGATVRMRYTFDNSKGNPRNPNQPPQRVRSGVQSTDEMGEFWFQFLPHREADLPALSRDFVTKVGIPDKMALAKNLLERNPKDAAARTELAVADMLSGKPDDALREARQALADHPDTPRAHSVLGSIYAGQNKLPEARAEFEAFVALEPENESARNNLGFLLLAEGRPSEAIPHLEKAVSLDPDDALARQNLEKARAAKNK